MSAVYLQKLDMLDIKDELNLHSPEASILTDSDGESLSITESSMSM